MFCQMGKARNVPDTTAGFVERAQHFGMLIVICIVIWAVTGAGSFWPIWVIAFGGISMAKRAHRTFVRQPLDA